jgi:hypothetical protein
VARTGLALSWPVIACQNKAIKAIKAITFFFARSVIHQPNQKRTAVPRGG